VKTLICNST